jgi:hypothetical protein
MATAHNDCLDSALDRLLRLRRELVHESDAESLFRAAFRFGVCEWCGCQVEDERYSDCELIFNPRDPTGEGELVCRECLYEALPLRASAGLPWVCPTPPGTCVTSTYAAVDRSFVEPLHRGFDKA